MSTGEGGCLLGLLAGEDSASFRRGREEERSFGSFRSRLPWGKTSAAAGGERAGERRPQLL